MYLIDMVMADSGYVHTSYFQISAYPSIALVARDFDLQGMSCGQPALAPDPQFHAG
jgi:hypothetical protein